jgi:ribosomal protein S18 acetylase RimI-like enzyme
MSDWQPIRVRHGTADDAIACQSVARQFRDELPKLTRAVFTDAVKPDNNRRLFVAELDGDVVGFVRWNATRHGANAGHNVVYDLAVTREAQGRGVGRALLYAVPCPIRLKCTADNERANRFYVGAGMTFGGQEDGKRPLNVYDLRILSILCQGRNKAFPAVARASGWAYGTRHDYAPSAWPFMVDIAWREYDWNDYMDKICRWHPVQAMCADYERPSQRQTLYRQIRDLRAAGVLRVKVCPKFDGAVAHIPSWCVVAVSVPSQYAGFLPDLNEVRGRHVHLLGGTPAAQIELISKIAGHGGRVISLDGNSHESAAKKGTHFEGGKWHNYGKAADRNATMIYSGRAISREAGAATLVTQWPLFGEQA